MIGLTINDKLGNVVTYYPHIQDNQLHFDIENFQSGVEGAALSIAAQLNAYVSTLDLANVSNITLQLNGNEVKYFNEINN